MTSSADRSGRPGFLQPGRRRSLPGRRTISIALAVLAAAAIAGPQDANPARPGSAPAPRLLFSSDWSGSGQIYALDPSRPANVSQLTFGSAPACVPGSPCGFTTPLPSPDGRLLLFTDYRVQGPLRSRLFVARADGRARRTLGTIDRGHGFPAPDAAWAPGSKSIAYAGADGIHVVRASGSGDRLLPTSTAGDFRPAWSADAQALAFVHPDSTTSSDGSLVAVRAGTRHALAHYRSGFSFAWSPVGRRLAYASPAKAGLFVVNADASGRRKVLDQFLRELAWAPDGRLIAFADSKGVGAVDVRTEAVRRLDTALGRQLTWSADGRFLAYTTLSGHIRVAELAGRRARELVLDRASLVGWSPDGRSLAYLAATGGTTDFGATSDLRIASLSGATRTLVAGAGSYGGALGYAVWTLPVRDLRYRPAAPRSLAVVSSDHVTAPWPVERIAADGGRIAYTACGHAFVWTPSTRTVVQAEASTSLSPACAGPAYYTSYRLFALALARTRVALGGVQGGIGRSWWLGGASFGAQAQPFLLGEGHSTNGPAYGQVVGEPAGSGDLLVFSRWQEELGATPSTAVTSYQQVQEVPVGGCTCPVLASSPGPLVPFDVDRGRVVAGGDNETWLVDVAGTRFLTIAFSPSAAQLAGGDLVLVRRGELRHYDASTGALLHTWPLPDVTAGRECASPNSNRCYAQPAQLVLEDAARGRVAYLLDGRIHVLRLADGADAIVATGTAARFMDDGLAYVDGQRLQLVAFDRLPLQ